ncbi:efflux RND transporter periplasmic adaptor subunit [Lacimicrobium sp. SS2-24]|uniref:efflux RND transporter periplasmic adaptor subunit n=1 Tax=Lacimicrobium sp. SS2-24 TaxID=2005569 RepID=UPI000B4A71CC|nr:efflux RND transporter periplasmic adaptor subunit [Lacimicrobium sp. SS2-24]
MRSLLALIFSAYMGAVAAAPGAHGPDGQHITDDGSAKVSAMGRQADGSVLIPMPDQAKLGIRTQLVTDSVVNKRIRLPAVVRANPRYHSLVQPGTDGRVKAPKAGIPLSGTEVSAGEVLAMISYQDSAYELASQTGELLSLRNQIEQTRRDVARLEELGELASRQTLEQLQTQLRSLVDREIQLSQGLEKPQPLTAPISGILINHQVSNGMWVEAGTTLFEIVQPQQRMIYALSDNTRLPERFKTATLEGFPGSRLDFIGNSPKLTAGMLQLHFELATTGETTASPLPIDLPVTVLAESSEELEGIVLPAEAVVRNANNLDVVWIKVSARRFMPQVVEYQSIGDAKVVITRGLGIDNRVVVDGTSLLNQVR